MLGSVVVVGSLRLTSPLRVFSAPWVGTVYKCELAGRTERVELAGRTERVELAGRTERVELAAGGGVLGKQREGEGGREAK